jgi:N-acyl-D-amino-acid deacylase
MPFDYLIRGGAVHDGLGSAPVAADVALEGDRIAAIGRLRAHDAREVIDARGLAVAPGFINMLSWSNESLLHDGRSQGEVRQGVTLQVLGEGRSMGPLNPGMKRRLRAEQTNLRYEIEWTTLSGYLRHLERRGVSQNVASFIGAATVRTHVLGLEDVQPTPKQLARMCELVHREMKGGAMGVSAALIYPPGAYARTAELVALCRAAARHGGMYISHVRDEGAGLLEAIQELIGISREAGIRAEIYHLKASGRPNWKLMDRAIALIEAARDEGLRITADMYLYPASSTGLSSQIPSWAHSGGNEALFDRLERPAIRAKIVAEMRARPAMPKTLLVKFRKPANRGLIGRYLGDVARERGTDEVDALVDLVLEDRSRIQAVFFTMSEANIVKQLRHPWVAIGSDGASMAAEGAFLEESTHPRAYGNFARLLGRYVRAKRVLPLAEAVRRMTGLPAANLGLEDRGRLQAGMFADVVAFDPRTIADRATYRNPHRYAVGMRHVFVNGEQVLRDGEHTGAKPGRAVWGPGKSR